MSVVDAEADPPAAALSTSVIVPTFKRMDLLPRCLAAIEQLTPRPIEIIVCHRPDADPDTARWLNQHVGAHELWKLVDLGRPGQVAALNAALEVARGDILAIFDDDATPHSDWLSIILKDFADENVAAVGGSDIVHGPDGAPITRRPRSKPGLQDWWGEVRGGHEGAVGPPRPVDVLKGCNWAIRRRAIGTLKFDERLPGTGAQAVNDYWFCLNLRQAGWTIIFDPAARVEHFAGFKPDYSHGAFPRLKCFEWTAGSTAAAMAFASPSLKLRNIVYHVLCGERHCPGLLFIAHSLVRRPGSLPGQLIGGWSGYLVGFRLATVFRSEPPGEASRPKGALAM